MYNLNQYEHGADDVLVMGTDGLWDVLSNKEVNESVSTFLANCDPDDLYRCVCVQVDLRACKSTFFCIMQFCKLSKHPISYKVNTTIDSGPFLPTHPSTSCLWPGTRWLLRIWWWERGEYWRTEAGGSLMNDWDLETTSPVTSSLWCTETANPRTTYRPWMEQTHISMAGSLLNQQYCTPLFLTLSLSLCHPPLSAVL